MKSFSFAMVVARRRISNIDGQEKGKKSGSAGRMLVRRKTAQTLQEDDRESQSDVNRGPTVSFTPAPPSTHPPLPL